MERSLADFEKDALVCVTDDTSIAQAQLLAAKREIHHLLVLLNDALCGVICTCDMEPLPPEATVSEFMREPVTLSLKHTWLDAIELMNECGVGSIILLDDETPRGIVTRGDILERHPPPDLAVEVERCSCCGATSHLRQSDSGRALCQICRKVPRGARARFPLRSRPPPF